MACAYRLGHCCLVKLDKVTGLIALATTAAVVVFARTGGPMSVAVVAVAAGVASAAWWQLRLNQAAKAAAKGELAKATRAYAPPPPGRAGGVARLLRPEDAREVRLRPGPAVTRPPAAQPAIPLAA